MKIGPLRAGGLDALRPAGAGEKAGVAASSSPGAVLAHRMAVAAIAAPRHRPQLLRADPREEGLLRPDHEDGTGQLFDWEWDKANNRWLYSVPKDSGRSCATSSCSKAATSLCLKSAPKSGALPVCNRCAGSAR